MSKKIIGATVGTTTNPDKFGGNGVEEVYIGDNPPDTAKIWIDLDNEEDPTVLSTLQAIKNEVTRAIESVENAKEEQTKSLSITVNGDYDIIPDNGKVLSKASVNVSVPERYDEGYSVGKQDGYAQGYQQGVTDTEPHLVPLTATENKEYIPDDADGYSSVKVNVPLLYDEGYNAGHEVGFTGGKEVGRQEGYDEGYQKGYQKGFDDNKPVVEPLEVTENGTYTPTVEVDGYSPVTVNVPLKYDEGYSAGFSEGKDEGYNEGYQKGFDDHKPTVEPLTVTKNGTYTAPDGLDGYSPVSVNVPIPDGYIVPNGTKEITENGTHDVTEYSSVNVNVASGSITPEYQTKYQRVEYIESTTGCKIVTDIIANNETGMELLAKYKVLADRVPMGSRNDETASRFYIPYPLSTQTIYHGFNNGKSNTAYPAANVKYRATLNFLNNRCSFTKEEDTNTVKYTVALTETLVQQDCPIGIFCYLRGQAMTAGSSRDFIFYSARISQGNDVVREYIPCYRKSDGEIGLYEKYTGQFLVNEGSGTFTKGADVEW